MNKPTYHAGTPERGVVYAWEGEVAGLRDEIAELKAILRLEVEWLENLAEHYGGHPADTLKARASTLRLVLDKQPAAPVGDKREGE